MTQSILIALILTAITAYAVPPLEALRLIAAYPDHLDYYIEGDMVWHDGTVTQWDDGKNKSFDEKLTNADLEDQMSQKYDKATITKETRKDFDPGRIRSTPFFETMYGGSEVDVDFNMVEIDWFGVKHKVTTVNDINLKLTEVADRLKHHEEYLSPSAGTYNFRVIAGTNRLSCHSFGIAIDIRINVSRYWRWDKDWETRPGHISIPDDALMEIIGIFEEFGFIWGGRWYHYDSMHFEYRPELLLH
ncbi:MAG: M15 family metallopeptidase [Fibrobacterales bacterium]